MNRKRKTIANPSPIKNDKNGMEEKKARKTQKKTRMISKLSEDIRTHIHIHIGSFLISTNNF